MNPTGAIQRALNIIVEADIEGMDGQKASLLLRTAEISALVDIATTLGRIADALEEANGGE